MNEKRTKQRESNIELLRIITAIGVFVLHYNNTEMGGAFGVAQGWNRLLLYFLEGVFIGAVNLFMLISGYFMCQNKKISIWKPIEFLVQVIILSVCGYLVKCLINHSLFSVLGLAGAMLPTNYFIVFYCVVYLLSPFINILLQTLDVNGRKSLVILLLGLFSIYPTLIDLLQQFLNQSIIGLSSVTISGSGAGYTIVNFLVMYIIGAYMKLQETDECYNKWKFFFCFLCNSFLISGLALYEHRSATSFGVALSYSSPLVIGNAICIFAFFRSISIGRIKSINNFAKASLMMYLIHTYFLPYINVMMLGSKDLIIEP